MSNDPEPPDDEGLWFVPGPPEDSAPTDPPWPVTPVSDCADARAWRTAERDQYRALTRAAEAVARLGERLRRSPAGLLQRLALASVSAALKAEGNWAGTDRIALYQALRTVTGDDARTLTRAAWAVRRLTLNSGSPLADVPGFLGRDDSLAPQAMPGSEQPVGEELRQLSAQWSSAVGGLGEVHPLTRAAFALSAWRDMGLSPFEDLLEPAVAAMRIAGGTEAAPFLPLAADKLGRPAPDAGQRLAAFYAAAEAGALAAMLEVERMSDWAARAGAALSDLSGRTPPRLVAGFLRYPMMSAEMAANEAACSRAAARRNLSILAERGLIRETTGQDRYRFWSAQA